MRGEPWCGRQGSLRAGPTHAVSHPAEPQLPGEVARPPGRQRFSVGPDCGRGHPVPPYARPTTSVERCARRCRRSRRSPAVSSRLVRMPPRPVVVYLPMRFSWNTHRLSSLYNDTRFAQYSSVLNMFNMSNMLTTDFATFCHSPGPGARGESALRVGIWGRSARPWPLAVGAAPWKTVLHAKAKAERPPRRRQRWPCARLHRPRDGLPTRLRPAGPAAETRLFGEQLSPRHYSARLGVTPFVRAGRAKGHALQRRACDGDGDRCGGAPVPRSAGRCHCTVRPRPETSSRVCLPKGRLRRCGIGLRSTGLSFSTS